MAASTVPTGCPPVTGATYVPAVIPGGLVTLSARLRPSGDHRASGVEQRFPSPPRSTSTRLVAVDVERRCLVRTHGLGPVR
jgi:hypothetical protein